jgi:hypothetical protein
MWTDQLWTFLNSTFIVTVIAAGFGTFAGAVGAQIRIARTSDKRELVKAIHVANAATMIAANMQQFLRNKTAIFQTA